MLLGTSLAAVAIYTPPVIAAVLAFALGAKIRDWPGTVEWLERLRMPRPGGLAVVGLTSEAILILALIVAPPIGLSLTALWLATATSLLLRARRLNVDCGCFGDSSAGRRFPIARNALLMVASVSAAAQIGTGWLPAEVSGSLMLLGPGALLIQSFRG